MSSMKDKEINELERNLREQFESEMAQYKDQISKLRNEVINSKGQNREVANEMVQLTNENSQLSIKLTQLEKQFKEIHIESEKNKQDKIEIKAKFDEQQTVLKDLADVETYEELVNITNNKHILDFPYIHSLKQK